MKSLALCVVLVSGVVSQTVLFSDTFDTIPGWDRQGVVITKSLPWEADLMQDPSIIYAQGNGSRFKMWYGSLTNIGYATSDDGLSWVKKTDPIVSQTANTEKGALNQPSVVLRNGVWHMTYFGLGDDNKGRVHYASATNPAGPWTKGGAVLVPTESWEDDYIYNSSLMYDEVAGIWKMWYTAGKIASAGGEPEFICYATAPQASGPWTKHPSNPLLRPMNDGGWASLGVGGPNVRKLKDGTYEMVILGWQADYPSRGGRILSKDGIAWSLDRSAMHLDLGVAGGVEDAMIYRQFVVDVDGVDWVYYNVKNGRTSAWIETINLAQWRSGLSIVDPAKWAMLQGTEQPNGASFEVRSGRLWSLGNAPSNHPQTLQGNALIRARDYAVSAEVVTMDMPVVDRDNVLFARYTDRGNYYYGGIASWSNKYAIGKLVNGQNTKLAGVGSANDITAGTRYRLRLQVKGNSISLFDGDTLVLQTTDGDLQPATSYVGLQTTTAGGHATFDNVKVTSV
ncbi:Arabinanase/levansucrase/invertase [Exidia glandulosa HHB12029]|uniref:Arabinanase/levansucrase/invertase n=1 Tax=Exidia glandulosa HHB12029 TaxID=1314781 RepID=A0A165EG81_EXIGL|nr:Arabinanase/levansucrase/invertase [Exidia glandulosa HHB12029]